MHHYKDFVTHSKSSLLRIFFFTLFHSLWTLEHRYKAWATSCSQVPSTADYTSNNQLWVNYQHFKIFQISHWHSYNYDLLQKLRAQRGRSQIQTIIVWVTISRNETYIILVSSKHWEWIWWELHGFICWIALWFVSLLGWVFFFRQKCR